MESEFLRTDQICWVGLQGPRRSARLGGQVSFRGALEQEMRADGAGPSSLKEVSQEEVFLRASGTWGPEVPSGSGDSLGQEDGRLAATATNLWEDVLPLQMGAAGRTKVCSRGQTGFVFGGRVTRTLLYYCNSNHTHPLQHFGSSPSDSTSSPGSGEEEDGWHSCFWANRRRVRHKVGMQKGTKVEGGVQAMGCSRGPGTQGRSLLAFTPLRSPRARENSAPIAIFLGVSLMPWRGFSF